MIKKNDEKVHTKFFMRSCCFKYGNYKNKKILRYRINK